MRRSRPGERRGGDSKDSNEKLANARCPFGGRGKGMEPSIRRYRPPFYQETDSQMLTWMRRPNVSDWG
jgi:hypothetical protein